MWLVQSLTTCSRGVRSKSRILLPFKWVLFILLHAETQQLEDSQKLKWSWTWASHPEAFGKLMWQWMNSGGRGSELCSTWETQERQSFAVLYFSVLLIPDFLVQDINKKHLLKMHCTVERAPGQGIQTLASTPPVMSYGVLSKNDFSDFPFLFP